MSRTLESLRALAYQAPDEADRDLLWEILSDCRDLDARRVAVDYARGIVARWPEALRAPAARWLSDPNLQLDDPCFDLLDEATREHTILTLIAARNLTPAGQRISLTRAFPDSPRRAQALWKADDLGLFDLAANREHWDALADAAPGSVDPAGLARFFARLSASPALAQLNEHFGMPGWDWCLEAMLQSAAPPLDPLVEGWATLADPLRLGLGFALARRGMIPGAALGPDAPDRVAEGYLQSWNHQRSCFHGKERAWDTATWSRALADALLRRSPRLDPDHLDNLTGCLPHVDDPRRGQLIALGMRQAARADQFRLSDILAFLDQLGDEAVALIDAALAEAPDRRPPPGHLAGNLLLWRLHREADPDAMDERWDDLLGHLPSWFETNTPLKPPVLDFIVEALAVLPERRLAALCAAWSAGPMDNLAPLAAPTLQILERLGPAGRAALGHLGLRLSQEFDLTRSLWLCLRFLETIHASGAPIDAHVDPILAACMGYPYEEICPILSGLDEPRREALILADGRVRWFYAAACPTPRIIEAAVNAIASWPRGNHAEQPQAADALRAFGLDALPALDRALLGEPAPHRALLAVALAELADPGGLAALLHLLADPHAGVRAAAIHGIAALGEPVALEPLCAALLSRRKRERVSAAEAIALLPSTPTLQARLNSLLSSQDLDAEARAALQSARAAETPTDSPLDDARRLLRNLDPAEVAAIKRDLERTSWIDEPWRAHLHRGLPLLAVAADWLKGLPEPTLRNNSLSERILDGVFGAFRDAPMAGWLLIDLFEALSEESLGWVEARLRRALVLNAHLIAPVCSALIRDRSPVRKALTRWLAQLDDCPDGSLDLTLREHPSRAAALLAGLSDHSAPIRAICVGALARMPAERLLPAIELLTCAQAPIRVSAAALLEAVPSHHWIAPLEDAARREAPARVREAIDRALIKNRLAELLGGPPLNTEAAALLERSVATLLCGAPAARLPTFLTSPLPALRMAAGAPLSDAAPAWVVEALAADVPPARLLDALAARFDRSAAEALCDAIDGAFEAAGRPGRERGWVMGALALLGGDRHIWRVGHGVNDEQRASSHWIDGALAIFERYGGPSAIAWCAVWRRFAFNYALKYGALRLLDLFARQRDTDEASLIEAHLPDHPLLDAPLMRSLDRHLEEAMIARRAWTPEAWRALFTDHRLGPTLRRGLLFEASGEGADRIFFVHEDQGLVSPEGEAVALAGGDRIVILHPLDASAAVRARWDRAGSGWPAPRLEQRDRGEPEGIEPPELLKALAPPPRPASQLHHALTAMGYSPRVMGNRVDGASRRFGDDIEVTLSCLAYNIGPTWIDGQDTCVTEATLWIDGRRAPWAQAPERVSHEVCRELAAIATLKTTRGDTV